MFSSPEFITLIPWNNFTENEQTQVTWKGTIHTFGVYDPHEAIAVDHILMGIFGDKKDDWVQNDEGWKAFNLNHKVWQFNQKQIRRVYCFPTNQLMLEMFLRINQQPVKS